MPPRTTRHRTLGAWQAKPTSNLTTLQGGSPKHCDCRLPPYGIACPASHRSFFEFKLRGPSSKPFVRDHGPFTSPTTHKAPRSFQTHRQTPATRPAAHFLSQDAPPQLSCLRLHSATTQPPLHRQHTSSLPTHHKQPCKLSNRHELHIPRLCDVLRPCGMDHL